MVISDKYRYLFIELPHTGSTAISRELRAQYSGELILHKHARYSDFLRRCSQEQKGYYAFSAIRNPLDESVSRFVKIRTTSKESYLTRTQRNTSQYVLENDLDFAGYLKYRYKFPFNNWSSLAHHDMNHIMRFERLNEEFGEVLQRLNIDQVRPLPVVNGTADKNADFTTYYTPDIIEYAKKIFGPFMQEWGYDFPAGWGKVRISRWTWLEYRLVNVIRNFYWKNLMYHPRLGRVARSIR